jgi:hypothetical protein
VLHSGSVTVPMHPRFAAGTALPGVNPAGTEQKIIVRAGMLGPAELDLLVAVTWTESNRVRGVVLPNHNL